jgi:hypothetical protein
MAETYISQAKKTSAIALHKGPDALRQYHDLLVAAIKCLHACLMVPVSSAGAHAARSEPIAPQN